MRQNIGIYKEICLVFLKLGFFAFGGPAAHIAMMETEIVEKRKWVTKEQFIDMFGFTNLIPGPNSTEMAILLGKARGGKRGLFLAGFSFIIPAFLIVLGFAYVYVRYSTIPEVSAIFNGIKPVILAIILQALFRLSKTALKGYETVVLFLVIFALSLFGISEIPLLLIAAVGMFLYKKITGTKKMHVFDPITLIGLFLIFLKIGAVLYGSGYVLVSFLNTELVTSLGLITNTELLDAIAIGQFTPGPVFTTASFIGYLILGVPGALVATIGIFLPAFLIILLFSGLIDRMRNNQNVSILLDGVNAASIAFMASVTIKLGMSTLISVPYAIIFLLSGVLLIKYKVNATYLILAGAVLGYLVSLI
jgi:chromate transporter